MTAPSGAAIQPAAADLVTGLNTPWGIGFLPDRTGLVTSRDDGTITAVKPDGSTSAVGTVQGVSANGEAGLLGLAVSPDYSRDHTVFVYYTGDDDNRIAALTLTGGTISDQRSILTGLPKAGNHDGGRITFGPDGLLYVGVGDAGNPSGAQDLDYLGGKILRLNPDGSGAAGNPFPQAPLVYSYGHRNVQGLAFDDTGRLWAAEFGQNTWDELNLIVPGGNYGWPNTEGLTDDPTYVSPQRVWATSEASPSGIAIWRGSVWMAGLRGQTLWQIPITGSSSTPTAATGEAPAGRQTGEPIAHLREQYGRLRTVIVAPDDSLWLTTSNTDGRGSPQPGDDRILRLTAG